MNQTLRYAQEARERLKELLKIFELWGEFKAIRAVYRQVKSLDNAGDVAVIAFMERRFFGLMQWLLHSEAVCNEIDRERRESILL